MAFRSQILFFSFLAATSGAVAESFPVRGGGVLRMEEDGMTFVDAKKRLRVWTYEHVQQVLLMDHRMEIVTYEDGPRWKLGVDRNFHFRIADPSKSFRGAADLLLRKLDQRFVAGFADPPAKPEWKVLVKRLGLVKGAEGALYVEKDRLTYVSSLAAGESRTWRLRDVVNVNSSDRFELTLTTRERSRASYGGMRVFQFRLKQPIDARRVDELWLRVERAQ